MQTNLNQTNKNNQRHGLWENYYSTGQPWYKGEYIHGKLHGPWITYCEDGSLSSKQTFDMGKRIGYFIHYRLYKCSKRFYAN